MPCSKLVAMAIYVVKQAWWNDIMPIVLFESIWFLGFLSLFGFITRIKGCECRYKRQKISMMLSERPVFLDNLSLNLFMSLWKLSNRPSVSWANPWLSLHSMMSGAWPYIWWGFFDWEVSKNFFLGPLHVLWQVSLGCWVTWSISSRQEYYRSVLFYKAEFFF